MEMESLVSNTMKAAADNKTAKAPAKQPADNKTGQAAQLSTIHCLQSYGGTEKPCLCPLAYPCDDESSTPPTTASQDISKL